MYRLLRSFVLIACLSLAMNQSARAEVVINEIMFNSAGTDTEYVEVINTGDLSVDLFQ